MIRLRLIFERGRAHPILGPIVIIVLVLLLTMVFLHVLHEGMEAVTEMGTVCIALASALGWLMMSRLSGRPPLIVIRERVGRSPPQNRLVDCGGSIAFAATPSSTPLRR